MIKDKQELNLWLSIGIVNAAAIYVTSLFFPAYVVIGNEFIEGWMAAILTALLLTVILALVEPVMKAAKLKVKGDLPIGVVYGLTNMAGLWVLARLARYVGFGVSSFVVVIALGVVLILLQFVVWKGLVGGKGRK